MAGRAMRALKDGLQVRIAESVKLGSLSVDGGGNYDITATEWSDYHGSTYHRSNARRLAEDFAMCSVTELSGGAWFPASVLNDADWQAWPDFAERMTSLLSTVDYLFADYPVYDDSDLSELESQIVDEAWNQWFGADIRNEIGDQARKLLGAVQTPSLRDAWEDAFDTELDRVDDLDVEDTDSLRSMFFETVYYVGNGEVTLPGFRSDIETVFESATSFVMHGANEVCQYLAEMLVNATDPRDSRHSF